MKRTAFLRTLLLTFLSLCIFSLRAAESQELEIFNPGFEKGLSGWRRLVGSEAVVSSEKYAEGKNALLVKSPREVFSSPIKVETGAGYKLTGKCYLKKGWGLKVRVRKYDKSDKLLNPYDSDTVNPSVRDKNKWADFELIFFTTNKCDYVRISIYTYDKDVTTAAPTAWLDDFKIAELEKLPTASPWEGRYKLKPLEKERLTAADVAAPDGVVYPNWRTVGVQCELPKTNKTLKVSEFGGFADDGNCDADAIMAGCRALGQAGGGVLLLGEGTYRLTKRVVVRSSGVIIRGAGRQKTDIVFELEKKGVTILPLTLSDNVGSRTPLRIICSREGLKTVKLYVDGSFACEFDEKGKWEELWGIDDYVVMPVSGEDIIGKFDDGKRELKAVAYYEGGIKKSCKWQAMLDSNSEPSKRASVIAFSGGELKEDKIQLAEDGKRGEKHITLKSVDGLKAGQKFQIVAPPTERWNALVGNECQWGYYRRYALEIDRVDGMNVYFTQPLRIDFPVIDGAFVRRYEPIESCGIENLHFEQKGEIQKQLKLVAINFHNAWNCRAENIAVERPGTHAVYGIMAKWCEIRNCKFINPWYKGGGGSAYAGWSVSWDCLIENLETFRMRHAPCLNWGCSGNVIRDSVFYESDGQWHSGWCHENLFENCVIESTTRRNNSYGYGLYATMPEDVLHGPIGPRNVIYNCDISSLKSGLWMGGMNENWLIMYNRFVVEKGQGIFGRRGSFDHIIKGNVFVLKDKTQPLAYFSWLNCTGVELVSNSVYGGNGKFIEGLAAPAVLKDNKSFNLGQMLPARPDPQIPSIYDWQN